MASIDFRNKINWHRRYRSPQGVKTEHEILRIFESDRGRIINSPAIRRLQQKTQVFPLERNAAVRTRLTHSMEVQQVGRYIAKEILSRLKEQNRLEEYGLDALTGPFESIVEMACLMHDIGNPPFGHFGEAAINDWFRQRLHPEDAESQPLTHDRCVVSSLRLQEGEENLNDIRRKVRQDICHFEGNAQGIRLVHTLMRMNLTWAQVGGILKYTRPAWWRGPVSDSHRYLMKKPGYYLSEEKSVASPGTAANAALAGGACGASAVNRCRRGRAKDAAAGGKSQRARRAGGGQRYAAASALQRPCLRLVSGKAQHCVKRQSVDRGRFPAAQSGGGADPAGCDDL